MLGAQTLITLPPLPVVLPLFGAALLSGLRRWTVRTVADTLSIAIAGANLVLCALLLAQSFHHTIVYWFGNWYPRGHQAIGIVFVVDPAAAILATIASLLMMLALLFSWRFVDAGANHFQPLMLVFLAAMCGFAYSGDLFNMFVFFELMSTAAFALCGLKIQEPAPLQGAFNFAVTNTIAAFMVLTGIAMLYAITGALNLAQMGAALGHRHDAVVLFAATLLTCGFCIKGAIVPFHFWLPDAHSVAPTSVCVLFSGLMVELGLYAVARLHTVVFGGTFSEHPDHMRAILLGMGIATVLLGGVMCYAQHHLKRLLAFSTVCHAGLMLCAVALHTRLAFAGLLLYLVAHALVKSGLFFSAGMVLHRLRSVNEARLACRGTALWGVGVLWFLGAIGLAGAPPIATMLGEAFTSAAGDAAGIPWMPAVFIFGGTMTGAAVLRSGLRIFCAFGEPPISDRAAEVDEMPETDEEHTRLFWYHYLPTAVCTFGAIALTLIPAVRAGLLVAGSRLADGAAYIQTVYGGAAASAVIAQGPAPEVFRSSTYHGVLALSFAALLALSSVLRLRLPRALRVGALLEGPLVVLRTLQSGHPGDYVAWLTLGAAGVGLGFFLIPH